MKNILQPLGNRLVENLFYPRAEENRIYYPEETVSFSGSRYCEENTSSVDQGGHNQGKLGKAREKEQIRPKI